MSASQRKLSTTVITSDRRQNTEKMRMKGQNGDIGGGKRLLLPDHWRNQVMEDMAKIGTANDARRVTGTKDTGAMTIVAMTTEESVIVTHVMTRK